MAIPLNAVEITWTFDLNRDGTQEDIAEFSIWCYDADYAPDQAGLLALAIGGGNAWTDNVATTPWTSNVALATITARNFQANGHTLMEARTAPTNPWAGSGGEPALPWETSLALSLYTYERGTFVTNGRRKRGRIYLPPMSSQTLESSNSGYFSNAALPGLLTRLVDFVGRVGQDGLGVKHTHPGIYSRVDGVVRDITQLSIDAKFDSQRRRQNREVAGILGADYHE